MQSPHLEKFDTASWILLDSVFIFLQSVALTLVSSHSVWTFLSSRHSLMCHSGTTGEPELEFVWWQPNPDEKETEQKLQIWKKTLRIPKEIKLKRSLHECTQHLILDEMLKILLSIEVYPQFLTALGWLHCLAGYVFNWIGTALCLYRRFSWFLQTVSSPTLELTAKKATVRRKFMFLPVTRWSSYQNLVPFYSFAQLLGKREKNTNSWETRAGRNQSIPDAEKASSGTNSWFWCSANFTRSWGERGSLFSVNCFSLRIWKFHRDAKLLVLSAASIHTRAANDSFVQQDFQMSRCCLVSPGRIPPANVSCVAAQIIWFACVRKNGAKWQVCGSWPRSSFLNTEFVPFFLSLSHVQICKDTDFSPSVKKSLWGKAAHASCPTYEGNFISNRLCLVSSEWMILSAQNRTGNQCNIPYCKQS